MKFDATTLMNEALKGFKPYEVKSFTPSTKKTAITANLIKLNNNENPFGPSPKALAAIQTASRDVFRYPAEYQKECEQKLAEYLRIPLDHLLLGNGSDGILTLIARTFLSSTLSAIYSQYSFTVYSLLVQLQAAEAIVIPNKNWNHDLNKIAKAIKNNTRIIFLDNPINPTGAWLTANNLQLFLEKIPLTTLVVIDEAYGEFASSLAGYQSAIQWIDRYPNIIVLHTFSKAFGLAGLRLGYTIAHPSVIHALKTIREPYSINILALAAGMAVLQDQEYLDKTIKNNNEGKKFLTDEFKRLNIEFIPSATNFITFKLPKTQLNVADVLRQENIIVRDLLDYGLKDYFRTTIGLMDENKKLIVSLAKICC